MCIYDSVVRKRQGPDAKKLLRAVSSLRAIQASALLHLSPLIYSTHMGDEQSGIWSCASSACFQKLAAPHSTGHHLRQMTHIGFILHGISNLIACSFCW